MWIRLLQFPTRMKVLGKRIWLHLREENGYLFRFCEDLVTSPQSITFCIDNYSIDIAIYGFPLHSLVIPEKLLRCSAARSFPSMSSKIFGTFLSLTESVWPVACLFPQRALPSLSAAIISHWVRSFSSADISIRRNRHSS